MNNVSVIPLQVSEDFKNQYFNFFYEVAKEAFEAAKQESGIKRYMTKKEACSFIGISFNHFQKLEALGLPTIQIGGKILVDREDIIKFLNQQKSVLSNMK
ncbi:helix-turn-helix domain-containing protein [Schinkia azotoformans]|uniref:helix-turn-helix domain-containing protein n=1 Tax=Schinkia azotoformans TaxID=1454 RepID=UPI002DB862A2|nr:helix-turn-helix domain-containing protein [Schinkia azotoformans]MEC1723914.1 helix-turn-helix domain-containing protein [Schinkia azotoformans]